VQNGDIDLLTFWSENWHTRYSCPRQHSHNFGVPRHILYSLQYIECMHRTSDRL